MAEENNEIVGVEKTELDKFNSYVVELIRVFASEKIIGKDAFLKSKVESFSSRAYEKFMTDGANYLEGKSHVANYLKDYIKSGNLSDDEFYTNAFILFTYYRHNSNLKEMSEVLDLANKRLESKKNEYPLIIHMNFLYKAINPDDASDFLSLINQCQKVINDPKSHLSSQFGVVHNYCEMVAKYYELHLDERDSLKGKETIEGALNKINEILQIEKKYPKYYVTLGRLLALSGKYDEGRSKVYVAMNMIDPNVKKEESDLEKSEMVVETALEDVGFKSAHDCIVKAKNAQEKLIDFKKKQADYEAQLNNIKTIQIYDLNNQHYKEFKNFKYDNLKSVSVIAAIISFIIGGVNMFFNISEPVYAVFMVIAFLGIIFVMLSICLLGISFIMDKENKKNYLRFGVMLLIGIAIISIAVALMLNIDPSRRY